MKLLTKAKQFVTSFWTGTTQLPSTRVELVTPSLLSRRRVTNWKDRRHLIGYTEQNGVLRAVHVAATALLTHLSAIGRTGVGKSKLMLLLALDYMFWGWGMLVCDPKGSAIEEILANVIATTRRTGCDAMLKRIILIELTPDNVPCISALRWDGIGAEKIVHTENAVRSFFAKQADVLIAILFRVMGEKEEGSPRIKRLLRAVFQAVGNAGLDLVDSLTLLDPFARHHMRVWEACKATEALPDEVVSDLEMIHALNRPQDKLAQIEGPLNRLRELFSPLVKAAFSEAIDAIDFGAAVKGRKNILVNARETAFVSRAQTLSLLSVVLHAVIEARFSESDAELAKQPPFPILSDEAADTFGPDCERVLRKGRSLKMPLLLFTQNFSAYRHEDEDFTETVANECGLTVCFQSKTPTLETINILLHGRINFARATRVVDRPDGFDFVALPSVSRSRRRAISLTATDGQTSSSVKAITFSESDSEETGESLGIENRHDTRESIDVSRSASSEKSQRRSQGQSSESSDEHSTSTSTEQRQGESVGEDVSTGEKHGKRQSMSHQSGDADRQTSTERTVDERGYRRNIDGSTDGYANTSEQASRDRSLERNRSSSVGNDTSDEVSNSTTRRSMRSNETAHRQGSGASHRNSKSRSKTAETGIANRDETGLKLSQSSGDAEAFSHEHSLRRGKGKARAIAIQVGGSHSKSRGITIGEDEAESEGLSISPLARHRTEIEILPQLEEGLDVQRGKVAAELSTLGVAELLLRDDTNCQTLRVKVRDVPSPFDTDEEYFAAIEEARTRLREMHAFMKTPDLSREAEDRRVQRHLNRLAQNRQQTIERLEDDRVSDDQQDSNGSPYH